MVIVYLIERERLRHLEPLDAGAIHKKLADAGLPPSSDWGGVICDDEKVLIVYYTPPAPPKRIADALGIEVSDLTRLKEFEDKGKGVYKLYEGRTKSGTYASIEITKE